MYVSLYFDRFFENFQRVFELGEQDDISLKDLVSCFDKLPRNPDLRIILLFFIDQIYKFIPKKIRSHLKKDAFTYAPIKNSDTREYIGSGYTNSVYRVVYSLGEQLN